MWLDEVFIEHASGVEFNTNLKTTVTDLISDFQINVFDNSGFAVGDFIIIRAYDTGVSIWRRYVMEISSVSSNGQTLGVWPTPDYVETSILRAPDGTIEKVGNGYHELTNTPLNSSLDYDSIEEPIIVKASPGKLIQFNDQFEDRSKRWWFRCFFSNVDATEWRKIEKFMWWQARGHLLNLHTFIDDLPSVMTGFMRINGMTKSQLWNQTYRSFELYFEEAVI